MKDILVLDGDPTIDFCVDGEAESVIAVEHEAVTVPIAITENGHYTPSVGIDGYSSVDVDIKYQELVDYINGVTGATDSNLTDAVSTLISGYGKSSEMELIQSIPVNNVNSVDVPLNSNLFENHKSIIVIPNITMDKKDWLYLRLANTNVYGSFTFAATYPRCVLFKGQTFYEYIVKTSEAHKGGVLTEINLENAVNFHCYKSDVTMTGTINIYGSNLNIYTA